MEPDADRGHRHKSGLRLQLVASPAAPRILVRPFGGTLRFPTSAKSPKRIRWAARVRAGTRGPEIVSKRQNAQYTRSVKTQTLKTMKSSKSASRPFEGRVPIRAVYSWMIFKRRSTIVSIDSSCTAGSGCPLLLLLLNNESPLQGVLGLCFSTAGLRRRQQQPESFKARLSPSL